MGGGFPLSSLTLIEGASSVGKSVLCQQLAYGALKDGHGVAYFTTEYSPDSLEEQMDSIGLKVSTYLQESKLGVFSFEQPTVQEDAERLLATLSEELQRHPDLFRVIIVDDITQIASFSQDRAIIGFFSACKRLCAQGSTIILAGNSYAFDEKMLVRLRALCDAQLTLRAEKLGVKNIKTLEVRKANNTEMDRDNLISFEVKPTIGMHLVPAGRARA